MRAGLGIEITGSGTPTDPYEVASSLNDLGELFRVADTTSVNLTLTGTGSVGDPLELRATSTLKLTDLTDVLDPSGGPSVGEVPVWVGSGSDGRWEFQVPPPSPAGAVNVTSGISGVGSFGDPIKVEVSGVWGVGSLAGLGGDSTIGLAVYIDSAGKVRARPVGAPTWADVTGKPATFPPSSHTHLAADITDQANLNAGRVNSIRISSTATSVTPPAAPAAGDLWFFPKGT